MILKIRIRADIYHIIDLKELNQKKRSPQKVLNAFCQHGMKLLFLRIC